MAFYLPRGWCESARRLLAFLLLEQGVWLRCCGVCPLRSFAGREQIQPSLEMPRSWEQVKIGEPCHSLATIFKYFQPMPGAWRFFRVPLLWSWGDKQLRERSGDSVASPLIDWPWRHRTRRRRWCRFRASRVTSLDFRPIRVGGPWNAWTWQIGTAWGRSAEEQLVGSLEPWIFFNLILWFAIYWECHHTVTKSYIFQRGRSTSQPPTRSIRQKTWWILRPFIWPLTSPTKPNSSMPEWCAPALGGSWATLRRGACGAGACWASWPDMQSCCNGWMCDRRRH